MIWGIYNFGHLPISKEYPTWGEFSSIITPFITIVGAFLLFFQIKNESDKNRIQHYQILISKLPVILDSISHENKFGSDAIIEYCKNLKNNFGLHPRVLIGKISYIEVTIRNLIKDLNQNKKSINKEILKAMIIEILMFYYTNIYFCILKAETKIEEIVGEIIENDNGKNLIDYLKGDDKHYKTLTYNIDELNNFCYTLLKETQMIDLQNESEENSKYFKLNNTDYNDLLNYILKEKKITLIDNYQPQFR